jgi:ribosomal protein S18 acetylase RimI-like enzyme
MFKKIRIRKANIEDIPQILAVEEEAWPVGLRATEEMYRARIETFPKGTLVAEIEGKIQGVVVTQIVNFGSIINNKTLTWAQVTDNGFIKKTHDPTGDTLYGVNLSVSRYALFGVSSRLIEATGKLVVSLNLKRGVLGARIPKYYRYADKMTAEDYVKTAFSGKPLDPELAFYLRNGLEIVRLIPNYMPNDYESLGYGVLLKWENPFWKITRHSAVFAQIIGKVFPYLLRFDLGIRKKA